MSIRDEVCEILACVKDDIKTSLATIINNQSEGNEAVIKELCEKIDKQTEIITTQGEQITELCTKNEEQQACLDELKEELLGDCPMEIEERNGLTSVTVNGDKTAANPPGSVFNVRDAEGHEVGTAEVSGARYDEDSGKTTFTLTNNTAAAADMAAATTIKKRVTSLPAEEEGEGEGVKRA